MTGFMAAFLESLEMEDQIPVSHFHTEGVTKKDRFSCMTKFPKTRNSFGTSSKENVQINGAKSHNLL